MNDYRVNTSYAKALFLLSADRGSIDTVAEDMRLVSQVASENRQLSIVFANPTIKPAKKASIVDSLFAERVSPESLAFLRFVVRKNRSVALRGIADAYLSLWREHRGIVLSEITTFQPISSSAKERVRTLVEQHTGKAVELVDRTDPHMLGGFKLEFDNRMYDARLRTKIHKLRLEFAKNDYESKL